MLEHRVANTSFQVTSEVERKMMTREVRAAVGKADWLKDVPFYTEDELPYLLKRLEEGVLELSCEETNNVDLFFCDGDFEYAMKEVGTLSAAAAASDSYENKICIGGASSSTTAPPAASTSDGHPEGQSKRCSICLCELVTQFLCWGYPGMVDEK
jgi:hypothetical protein